MVNPTNKQQAIMLIMKGIQQDIRQYEQLRKMMIKQQECYIQFDGEALQSLTTRQQPLINALNDNAAQRSALMTALGLNPGKEGMTTLIHALPDKFKKPMGEQWQTLEQLVRACHQLNQVNGQISASYSEMLQNVGKAQSYASGNLMQL